MPAINLALFNVALVLRLVRAGVRETLPLDFIRSLHGRKRPVIRSRVLLVHVLKNIMIPDGDGHGDGVRQRRSPSPW